jgi:hypothetical protein
MSIARLLAIALGLGAAVVPWLLNALDVTDAGVHDGLWFACIPFAGAIFAPAGRVGRLVVLVAGLLAIAVVAIEVPGVWVNATNGRESAVAELLRQYARGHLLCYGVVALAGLLLVTAGLRRPRASATEADPADTGSTPS